ncbi:MAG: hypothetical protein Q8927_19415 [Bacteroidota bacterium]|nr:hypothetical protein [Bacteroidota bacterium]MDP4218373.1 hypothetical protein [Bacteroidota bacterium]MDP4254823.1 hypothetical protein [Bacteroidota bacterium]MDP4258358.1 hypothetical protein [Bacteroidota bacterium]
MRAKLQKRGERTRKRTIPDYPCPDAQVSGWSEWSQQVSALNNAQAKFVLIRRRILMWGKCDVPA